jgi:hypothetical protein
LISGCSFPTAILIPDSTEQTIESNLPLSTKSAIQSFVCSKFHQ